MESVLITGARGFLGYHLARVFRAHGWRVIGTSRDVEHGHGEAHAWLHHQLNGGDAVGLLDAADADVVIHAAALAARNDCEADPSLAHSVNVCGSGALSAACAARAVPFFFISTDLVFDGTAAPYSEDDPVSPVSTYGASKAAAETAVLDAHPNACVLRCSLMYGMLANGRPGSFLRWNVGHPLHGKPVQLYRNQFRCPLYAPDVPNAILSLRSSGSASGIYHLAGPDRLSRFEIGRHLSRRFGFSPELIVPTDLPRLDDCTLSTDRIRSTCGMTFTGFTDGIAALERSA